MKSEKRLIDANDLTVQLIASFQQAMWDGANSEECQLALDVIEEAPTVDTVEVVHGRWIFKHDPITHPKKYFIRIVCSECNLHTGQKSNYCPNCGAKMNSEV